MKRILHISNGWEPWNGAANIARMIGGEQSAAGHEVSYARWTGPARLRAADEVWITCAWTPCLWWTAFACALLRFCGRAPKVFWMPEGSYDPVRRRFHGWKKTLAGPVERWCLRRADVLVATCAAEADWIRNYEPRVRAVEVTDIRRFFDLGGGPKPAVRAGRRLRVLFLGRRHPLKGLEYLEKALGTEWKGPERGHPLEALQEAGAAAIRRYERAELAEVWGAFGAEKERVWTWCDVLCLPTLSENFGLVVAEALARGKRVIVTDGAPVWEHDGRLAYVKGFRNGTDAERIGLLKRALKSEETRNPEFMV